MPPPSPQVPIVDAHSDLLQELAFAEDQLGEDNPLARRWRAPLRRGGVALQVCAIYVDPSEPDALRVALRQVCSFHAALEANEKDVVAVRTAADLERIGERVGLLLALEGAACLGTDAWLIDVFVAAGVRMCSLTWNECNAFAAGCGHGGGLTKLGAVLVDRLVGHRVVLDLSHASVQTFHDVLERSGDAPVLVSHAACHTVHGHPRNLTEDQLQALAARGGVLGLMPHPLVVDPERPTLDRFLDHVDHAVAAMGIDHVGLGGDFMRQIMRAIGEAHLEIQPGMPADVAIEDLAGPADYPRLREALARRGYDGQGMAALLGGNLLRMLSSALPREAR